MHTERTREYWPKAIWIEGVLLLAVTPFLLFPAQSVLATAFSLILIIFLWVWPFFILRSPLVPVNPYNVALLLICLMVLVGILVTADPQLTLPKAAGIILGISYWRFIIVYVRRRPQLNWAVAGYILLGVTMTAVGFSNANWLLKTTSQVPYLQNLAIINPDQPLPISATQAGIHPNQIAGTITLFFPLLLSLLLGSQNLRRHKLFFLITIIITAITGITLLLTQSRSGWLGVAGGILALLILWGLLLPPSKKRWVVWTLIGLLILIAIILIFQRGPARIVELWLDPPQETAVGSLTTLNFRQEVWPWALSAIRDFPYTGTGLGTFRAVVRRLYPINVAESFDFAHAHNVFLQFALDLGIPGLIIYVALIIISIVLGWKIAAKDMQLRSLGIGLLAGLFAFHVYGLADTLAIGSKPTLLLWVVFALLGSANQISQELKL